MFAVGEGFPGGPLGAGEKCNLRTIILHLGPEGGEMAAFAGPAALNRANCDQPVGNAATAGSRRAAAGHNDAGQEVA